MKEVRTRFAPSPTGFLHVGGVRTALFAYLLAKRHGGKFLLRLEDTDQQRVVPGAIRAIVEDLQWLGVIPDEGPSAAELTSVDSTLSDLAGFEAPKGPYIQSLRKERYQQVAEELLRLGVAYRSNAAADTSWMERKGKPAVKPAMTEREQTLDEEDETVSADADSEKPGEVIRLRLPRDRKLSFVDGIRGLIEWESLSLNDPVLVKSDGFPTYHLAVVVDDHDMEISHVLRGEEWIPSTPIHLVIYEALGWEAPVFAHPASVLGEDGKKLSKRHGATSVSAFRNDGYLPEALLNFLALVGWSPGKGNTQEIFTKEELISLFSLQQVNMAAGVFSYQKLNWMNSQYLRKLSDEDLASRVLPYLLEAGHRVAGREEKLTAIIPHLKERMERLTDAAPQLEFLFKEPFARELQQLFSKQVQKPEAATILKLAATKLGSLEDFSPVKIDSTLREIVEETSLPMGGVFIAVRVSVLGKKATPPLAESISVLGREETVKRLQEAESLVKNLSE